MRLFPLPAREWGHVARGECRHVVCLFVCEPSTRDVDCSLPTLVVFGHAASLVATTQFVGYFISVCGTIRIKRVWTGRVGSHYSCYGDSGCRAGTEVPNHIGLQPFIPTVMRSVGPSVDAHPS